MTMRTRSVLGIGVAVLAAACGSVTAGPTSGATTTPAGTVSPAPSGPPVNSSALSTSWVDAADGWALGFQPCSKGTCLGLARTTDAGRHWQGLPGPAAKIQDGTVDCSAQACVNQVSFASASIGYVYGPALLMTTDGGLTWHAQPGPQTETLTIAGGQVYRVTYTGTGCPGPCQPSLEEAAVGSTSWRTQIGRLAEPDRSDSAQIVASGPDVLVAMYGSLAGPVPAQAVVYRSTDAGATWRQLTDPCRGRGPAGPSQEEDLVGLAAAPGGFFAGLCAPHNTTSAVVITSADAGATWRPTAVAPPGQGLTFVAAASPTTIAVASSPSTGSGTATTQLLVTTDGGRRWVTAAADTQNLTTANPALSAAPASLEFETSLVGHWLGDPHGIWSTTDGGVDWMRTAFR
jgi:photosystem II stability/assembly factor-like uncharacterized protein